MRLIGRRGDGAFTLMYKVVFGIILLIVVTMIFMALAQLVYGYKSSLTAVPAELQAEVIAYRFTHSPECLAYRDVSGRVQAGTVDISHFTAERLDACYPVSGEIDYEQFNFKLMLKERKVEIKSGNYYEAPDFTMVYDVSVVDPERGQYEPDKLIVYVQRPFKDKPLSGRVALR